MSILLSDCPRCNVKKIAFEIGAFNNLYGDNKDEDYWSCVESYGVCRSCHLGTIFILGSNTIPEEDGGLAKFFHEMRHTECVINPYIEVLRYVTVRDQFITKSPEHIPIDVEEAFQEGATCLSVECFNAAATMFRLCVDMTTKPLLPKENINGLTDHIRRTLGKRLKWLFDNKSIDDSLKELSSCIREDGNDGAHVGSLDKEEAEDLLDFTRLLLERLYTNPKRLELANERRAKRREK